MGAHSVPAAGGGLRSADSVSVDPPTRWVGGHTRRRARTVWRVSKEPATVTLDREAHTDRVDLGDGAWVDLTRGWLTGGAEVYRTLVDNVSWTQGSVFRYERYVDDPRLGAYWRAGTPPPHPIFLDAHRALQDRYGVRFDGCAIAWYRDGNDSVAFHRDRDLKWLDDTLILLLTLGQQRPFHLRPLANKYAHHLDHNGATHDLSPASGDLIVMGGSTQTAWQHSVPKVRRPIGGRISLQWRWTSKLGRQEVGGSYRKPRLYSR